MKINQKLNDAINAQIGEELKASNAYANMAAFFNGRGLLRLAGMFFEQSAEEREHAMKFLHYLLDLEVDVAIPAIPATPDSFGNAKAAFQAALAWEKDVTSKINHLMDLAVEAKDYASQDFLMWYVTEQVEEEATMTHLVTLAETLGDHPEIMLENYLPKE